MNKCLDNCPIVERSKTTKDPKWFVEWCKEANMYCAMCALNEKSKLPEFARSVNKEAK